jgi:signal peptidase I
LNEDEKKVEEYKAAGVSNPMTCTVPSNVNDQYIIKRVIAFPGERVTVKDGIMKVYNDEYPDGFIYDEEWRKSDTDGPKKHTSGEVDVTVPNGELFVSGDNREGSNSWDSRNGLGTIPFCRIVGPVAFRLFPFNSIRTF